MLAGCQKMCSAYVPKAKRRCIWTRIRARFSSCRFCRRWVSRFSLSMRAGPRRTCRSRITGRKFRSWPDRSGPKKSRCMAAKVFSVTVTGCSNMPVTAAASGTEYANQTSESASGHTHNVTIPNHTHGIAFGIYEESNSPSITVNIDNGPGYGTPLGFAGDQLNLDLTSRLSGAGWKTLKFTASTRCRIAFVLECKLDISA